jgi:cyclic-di-GMP-binding protein
MPSFDIVSQIDQQEVDNALTQSQKEIAQRFDFKNTQTTLAWAEDHKSIVLRANSEGRVQAAADVLQTKLVKRGVPLKAVTFSPLEAAGGQMQKQSVTFQQGIPVEKGKEIVKVIKDHKLKVQASIQGDQLRVTGKSRDDLQEAMALVRGQDFGVDVQFTNFRD